MDWIATVEREGRALAAAARHDLHAPVPTCPGWDVEQLVRHVGEAHHNAAAVLREGRTAPPESWAGAPSSGSLDWYEAGLDELVATLRVTDPATRVWTFSPAHDTAAFWFRRLAHETTVHRVDAELAAGAPGAVDLDLAVDGVDEWCGVVLPGMLAASTEPVSGTLHLHATDAEGEWLLAFDGTTVTVTHGHAKGDAAVRGPAGMLYRWLWGRASLDDLEVFGDATMAAAPERFRI